MTQLYTATEVVTYMSREHNVTMYKQTVWQTCRRHGIQPRPHGPRRRLGITAAEIERLAQSYRPRVRRSDSVPQRAPKTVHSNGFTISEDASTHRPRLAATIDRVIVTAERAMLAHRAQVVGRMKRTGESAFQASEAIRAGW